jgi:hypothetical protein
MKALLLSTVLVLALGAIVSEAQRANVTLDQMICLYPPILDAWHDRDARFTSYLPHLNAALNSASINTLPRIRLFLAIAGALTGRFNQWTEANTTICTHYDGGCTFRGRGAFRMQDRFNYEAASSDLGQDFVSNPDRVAEMPWAFSTATWIWKRNNLNRMADTEAIGTALRIITGGLNELRTVKENMARAQTCICVGCTLPPIVNRCLATTGRNWMALTLFARFNINAGRFEELNPGLSARDIPPDTVIRVCENDICGQNVCPPGTPRP